MTENFLIALVSKDSEIRFDFLKYPACREPLRRTGIGALIGPLEVYRRHFVAELDRNVISYIVEDESSVDFLFEFPDVIRLAFEAKLYAPAFSTIPSLDFEYTEVARGFATIFR